MRLITRQSLANVIVERWGEQYPIDRFPDNPNDKYANKQKTLKGLIELGKNPSPDDVDKVIGNSSWTATRCDNCGVPMVDVLELGEELDYESRTIHICEMCIDSAKKYF